MKTNILIFTLGVIWMMLACDDESALKPHDKPESVYGEYMLPQGNHEYDNRIVGYYEQYGMVILYKFNEKEFWWNVTTDIRWKYDEATNKTKAGYEISPADTLYVGEQVTLLQDKFFTYFSTDFLKQYLPLKMLLVGELNYIKDKTGEPTEADRVLTNAYSGYDFLCVNRGNSDVKNMTPEQINQFKSDVCCTFLNRLFDMAQLSYSLEFIGVSNYSQNVTETTKYQYPMIFPVVVFISPCRHRRIKEHLSPSLIDRSPGL